MAQLSEAGNTVSELEQQITDTQARVAELEGQIDLSSSDKEQLEAQLAAAGETSSALEQQVTEAQDRITELQDQISQSNENSEQLEAQLAELTASQSELESRLADSDAEIQGLQEELQGAQSSASEQLSLAETLAQKLADIEGQQGDDARQAMSLSDTIQQSLTANGVDNAAVSVRSDNGVVINLPSGALFNSGRGRLSAEGRDLITRVGDALQDLDNNVVVEGHTDGIPVTGDLQTIFPSNWELSVARAANTVNYLQNEVGMEPERLSAAGYGEQRPVASNDTREGRALNRRVEIVVVP